MSPEPEGYFRIRAHRPKYGSQKPFILPFTFREPAEAADRAETWLNDNGEPKQSFCDLLFNGDLEPHISIFLLGPNKYGVWNRENIPWPFQYVDEGGSTGPSDWRLEIHPKFIAEGADEIPPAPEEDEGSHKKGDSTKMKIDGQDDEEDESDSEDEEGEDEDWDDEDDDGSENGSDDDTDDDEEDDEDEGDDQGEDDGEGEEEEPDESDDDEIDEDEEGGEGDEDSEEESESEMPRLTIFAKMRGPKGWRKRADAEELNETNVFGFKVGVLDPEGETPGTQEYNVRAEIKFVENDETRTYGILQITLPEGVILEQNPKTGKWLAQVPYYDEEE